MSDQEVRIIKFVTGEEVIAKIEYTEKLDTIFLTDPVLLIMQPRQGADGKSTLGIGLIPYATAVEGDIAIGLDKVLYNEEPKNDLIEMYLQATSSLDLPPPSKVQLLRS